MPIISKETWDKFTQEEKAKIRQAMKEIPNEKSSVETLLIELFPAEALKPKPLTYKDAARELFMGKHCYYTDFGGLIKKTEADYKDYKSAGYCISVKQAKKLLAINKLLNVAKFLNGDWEPDWENLDEEKWSIYLDHDDNTINVNSTNFTQHQMVYFRTRELAEQAIQILGEDTIRLALGDY